MRRILMSLIGLGMAGALVSAQSSKPMDLYQEGVYLQEVKGDLRRAIEVYRSILTRYTSNGSIVSKTLFQLATCYEKLGQPEATTIYQRLVREYPDAGAVTAAARTRLAALRPARTQGDAGLESRKLATLTLGGNYDLSASGDQVVFLHGVRRDLLIHDLRTGQQTVLVTNVVGNPSPVFSRDGRQIAYRSLATGAAALHVIGTEASAQPRTLVGSEAGFSDLVPVGWSADGAAILATTVSGTTLPRVQSLISVSVVDAAVRTLRSLGDPRGRSRPKLSPDGRFVTYSASHTIGEPFVPGTDTSRIFVGTLEGSDETEVVKTLGSHNLPVWTPDGGHILYLSDRSGGSSLWSVPISGGQAAGNPSVVLADFRAAPAAVSQAGVLLYGQTVAQGDQTYIVERGPGGRLLTSFPGGGGDWSPDGRFFAFKPAIGSGSQVIVRDMETAAERAYQLDNVGSASPHWLGSGGFVVNSSQGNDGETLYYCDVATGACRRLYPTRSAGFARWGFTMPDDGSRIYSLFTKSEPGDLLTGIVGVDPSTGEDGPVAMFPAPLRRAMPGVDVNRLGTAVVVMATAAGSTTTARLFVMGVDGSGYREVGEPFPVTRTPDLVRWTPDGGSILYVTTSNGKSRVMRISVSGGAPQFDGVEVDGTIWNIDPSPDGTRLAYSTTPPPNTEVWAIDNILAALPAR